MCGTKQCGSCQGCGTNNTITASIINRPSAMPPQEVAFLKSEIRKGEIFTKGEMKGLPPRLQRDYKRKAIRRAAGQCF